jgi:hypothetical protein
MHGAVAVVLLACVAAGSAYEHGVTINLKTESSSLNFLAVGDWSVSKAATQSHTAHCASVSVVLGLFASVSMLPAKASIHACSPPLACVDHWTLLLI